MTDTTPNILGWGRPETSPLTLCPPLAAQCDAQGGPPTPVVNVHGQFANVFQFLDQHRDPQASSTLVLQDVLLDFSNESNIRMALSRLLCEGAPQAKAYVAERTDRRNFAAFERAIHCLGLSHLCDITLRAGWCTVVIQRGRASDHRAWLQAAQAPGRRGQLGDVIAALQQAQHDRRGFSLVRFGHCESKFVGYGTHFGWSDLVQSATLQWGAPVSAAQALQLQADISIATLQADVVGIKPRTALPNTALDILNAAAMSVALERGLLRRDTLQVDSNIHFDLAGSAEFLACLAQAPSLVVVSPRAQAAQRIGEHLQASDRLQHIAVPGEFRVNGEGGNDVAARFQAFAHAEQQLLQAVQPGSAVLIGAGLVGKRWGHLASQQGALAIDLGSVLDAWAGVQSRSGQFPERVTAMIAATH